MKNLKIILIMLAAIAALHLTACAKTNREPDLVFGIGASDATGTQIGQAIFALMSCLDAAKDSYPEVYVLTKELYQGLYQGLNEGAGLK